ncbi:hypothetical protein C8Q75DRAFT_53308 [Abortiporus biennis]|nr:hypothetical protein C8Q75DRAFT_53308 [Abortiporus biennis]
MVFINDQKFSCESCIKGHRSSSCHHNDRPLFEVKKKGRPVSQCEKCRELRKTKKVHSKCVCTPKEPVQPTHRPISAKSKRLIPIAPALPNGLRDAFANREESSSAPPCAPVDSLLNPCKCKDVWSCKCRSSQAAVSPFNEGTNGLAALANAAALCCSADCGGSHPEISRSSEAANTTIKASSSVPVLPPSDAAQQKHSRDCCGSPGNSKRSKRQRKSSPIRNQQNGPELPPILLSSFSDTTSTGHCSSLPPVFPEIPPLSSIASLAGSGCCCGYRCTCPGCIEHRGAENVSRGWNNCADGCGTCVDYEGGIELPSSNPSFAGPSSSKSISDTSSSTSFIDTFFARAAKLPLPPPSTQRAVMLDPTNVTVYPKSLFSGEPKLLEERGTAFGLVRLPKLECCSGKCGCPGDTCACGDKCDGCCAEHDTSQLQSTAVVDTDASQLARRSCCC